MKKSSAQSRERNQIALLFAAILILSRDREEAPREINAVAMRDAFAFADAFLEQAGEA